MDIKLFRQLNKNTILHFDNAGRYGHDFKEIKIQFNGESFRIILTDGYRDLAIGYESRLKDAILKGFNIVTAK